jgi:cytochrome P450
MHDPYLFEPSPPPFPNRAYDIKLTLGRSTRLAKMIGSPVMIAIVAGLLTLIYAATRKTNRGQSSVKVLLKLQLIGDLHSSPIEKPLLNWDTWAKENGPIVVPKLFGLIPIVVLNSYEAVTELFSRRSQWYSNRPTSVSMEMITGAGPGRSKFTLMHDYDDHLKFHHRILAPSLGAPAAPQFQPLMELESKQLLFDLANAARQCPDGISTESIYPLLERTQSSVILALHYGLRIPTFEDPILHEIIDVQKQVTHLAANPGLPDIVPPLRHLPRWLSPWQRAADKLYATQLELYMRLLRHGKDAVGWNSTKQAISTAKKYSVVGVPELDLAFTLATSIQGGMETSPRQLLWLFIAALQEPSIMDRAHDLLDEIVGRDRLPRFSDRSELAFIDAITHELFRWRPIAPGSIPRRADRDDELNGVVIKKGVTIMANAWAVSRDEKVFDHALGDSQDFVPQRWLQRDESGEERLRTDLPLPVFGQGRRSCLGKRVATDGTFMQVASLLWAFDIELADGEELDPWAMVVVGFMTMPREINIRLRPRGKWVLDVIDREWETVEKSLHHVMGTGSDVEDR